MNPIADYTKQQKHGIPCLPDYDTIRAMNPSAQSPPFPIPSAIYNFLKDKEVQEAVNRYRWLMLPRGITQELIERILYFKGRGCLFYLKATDLFYFLPFAWSGPIDQYGRYHAVTPLPFHGSVDVVDDNGKQIPFIPGLELKPIYSVDELPDDWTPDDFEGHCLILWDRNIGITQNLIPREQLNDVFITMMSECPAFGRTNLIRNSGVSAWRVGNENDQGEVSSACDSMVANALNGNPFLAVVSPIEMQDLTSGGRVDAEQFYQVMQSLDSMRLMGFGLKSNGAFDKDSAYMNNQQVANMQQNVGLVYQSGLEVRQKFADLITLTTGIMTDCIASECVTNTDNDLNGVVGDDEISDVGGTDPVNTMEEE